MEKVIRIEKTRGKGLPALWEKGGSCRNTGDARIITGTNGEPLVPVYVRRKGELANSQHALFVITPGCFVIEAEHHRGDFTIGIYKIVDIDGDSAIVEKIAEFNQGEWDNTPPAFLEAAITASKEKALCYHCREPHYCKEE